jgi:hypothetical protein
LTFGAVHGGPGGNAIQIEISSPRVDDLVAVAGRVKDRLREFVGVYDIEDDFDAGQREVQVELLESGRALGLTTERLAMQVRAAFYGLEARKIQRDREDVKIMVRFPRAIARESPIWNRCASRWPTERWCRSPKWPASREGHRLCDDPPQEPDAHGHRGRRRGRSPGQRT